MILNSNDWDGVNIAELNFDADFNNWLRPDKFVPMNAEVRADFRKKAGFDPIQLFRPGSPHYYKTDPTAFAAFERYREDIVIDWHRRVLAEIEPLASSAAGKSSSPRSTACTAITSGRRSGWTRAGSWP